MGTLLRLFRGAEMVVGGQWMRRDPEIPNPRIIGEDDLQGRGLLPGSGASIEDVGDGGGGDSAASKGLLEGGIELARAVAVEELQESGCMAGHGLSP
jgi:hypothetical protein